jgi:hypothetical protein
VCKIQPVLLLSIVRESVLTVPVILVRPSVLQYGLRVRDGRAALMRLRVVEKE